MRQQSAENSESMPWLGELPSAPPLRREWTVDIAAIQTTSLCAVWSCRATVIGEVAALADKGGGGTENGTAAAGEGEGRGKAAMASSSSMRQISSSSSWS